eukprot:TRINITY_DN8124_c0_g1_i1.p1 TRINITY_DN8124_c0_g1~~TRINITY_DN8124_c0_g1_i1.p1  ORF type:complete len:103 (+),score=6.54 TRINITY_DN8124_c0_g1_i1:139-447(+)
MFSLFNETFHSPNPHSVLTSNDRLYQVYRSHIDVMKVSTADRALDDFVLKSARTAFDIKLDLRFPGRFSTCLIVRAWENIPLRHEFRGFIYQRKLCALSQRR